MFIASTVVIITTVSIISLSGYWLAKQSITDEVQRRVLGVLNERKSRVELLFEEIHKSMIYFTQGSDAAGILTSHLSAPNSAQDNRKRMTELLIRYSEVYESFAYCGMVELDGSIFSQSGNLQEDTLPADLSAFKRASHAGFAIGPIHLNSSGETVFNIGLKIFNGDEPFAIFLCQLYSNKTIEPILLDTSGLGWSGDAFLIGADTLMLTPSRFYNHPQPLTHKMPIPTALLALQGKKGVKVYQSFLGMEVVGAYTRISNPGWVLITEMVTEEAYAPLKTVARNTAIVSFLALIIMLYLSVLISRKWTNPMEQLAEASIKVADGDLTTRVSEDNRRDEIGTLARQFNHMVMAIADSRDKLEKSHNRLIQAEKLAAIGELVTGIVHEMRNPLSVIKMNLNLIQRKSANSTNADLVTTEQLELAAQEAQQLEKMLAELLDFSKPITLKKKLLSITKLVDKSINAIKQAADKSAVEVIFHLYESQDFEVYADEDTIKILLSNLALNAIHASRPGSQIDLSFRLIDGNLNFEVIDKGKGMSSNVRERILDPFFTTRDDGIGLGMSNVKKIIDLYGGTINIESQENVGTTVSIRLPDMENHG